MPLDAEKFRPAVEYLTRAANDFSSTNMFFIKNCSLLLREISKNPRAPANKINHVDTTWESCASSHSDSVMSFETEELVHFRGRDPVSAYPLIRLTSDFSFQLSSLGGTVIRKYSQTLPGPVEFLDFLLEALVRLVFVIRVLDHSRVSIRDLPIFHFVMQVEIYDLTSSERVKRGVKRAWLIGETLALETGSGQNQPNIHRTKYKGVRFRPSRSRAKPWSAEVKPPMEKNKVWIDDCDTPEAAAHAYDVAAFHYGKGNKALNFEHTPRFLPKTLGYSCEKEKKHAIQEQARHLRRNPLLYLIHQLPYDLLFCFVIWELYPVDGHVHVRLAFLVVELMRLMRKDSSVTAFPKWVSVNEEKGFFHAPTSIPQLLESIDCLIKKIPQQKKGYRVQLGFEFLFRWCRFTQRPLEAQDPTKDIPLTFQFIEWVRINLLTPQTTSIEAKHLPARLDVEIPNEGFQTGGLCEDIQESSMSGQMTSTSGTLSNFHALPFSCFSPLSTGAQTQSSTFMHPDVGKDLMMPIPSSMEVGDYHPNCNNLVVPLPLSHEYTQDALKQDLRNLDELPLECEQLAFQVTSPEEDECIKSPTVDQAAREFMDLDDGEVPATLFERLQHDQVGDIGDRVASVEATLMEGCNPGINDMVLTSVPVDQAATEFLDLDDGEDLATLFERPQHDQLGDIGDGVASDEATLMEGCNPDINDMVLTSVPGHIEGDEINSLCEYEHVMEPSHPFAFSQQPFVQFDEYL